MGPTCTRCQGRLEPIIGNTSSISRQIFEGIETIEMVDGNMRHGSGFGQAQVHGDAAATFLVRFLPSPKRDAATPRAEVEFDRLASNVGLGRSGDIDSLAFVVIGPQRSIAVTDAAVTGRGGLGHSAEPPADCAAMTGSLDHF